MNSFKYDVGVIGLGYVGLPRALQFCKKKIPVVGIDTDPEKIEKLKKGQSYLTNISKLDVKNQIKKKVLIPTTDFSNISNIQNIIICVPTPLTHNLTPDLSYVRNTFKKIQKYLKKNQMICFESTSYPGTTYEYFVKPLKKSFNIGENFFVSFSPERNDPGLKININKIPKIVSGYSKECLKRSNTLYKKVFNKVVTVETLEIAEMTKIYENVFRSVNIGFINEMKKICNSMNIDVHNVIEAAKSKPFGFMPFYPGPGLGGHCIPIDPFYLSWKSKKLGIKTRFIELSGQINRSMPLWVIQKAHKYYFKNEKKINFKGMKFLIMGIAYKKNINDMRESPSLVIIDYLKKFEAKVEFYDPFFSKLPKTRKYDFSKIKKAKFTEKNLKKFDGVFLITDHDKINYKVLIKHSKVIFDTRNKLRTLSEKIIKL